MNQKAGKHNLFIPFVLVTLLLSLLPVSATIRYVDAANVSPTAPYSGWSTAATNIQDAVDASSPGDTVLVTNGVYQYGGRPVNGFALTNRVAVTVPITLESVNGPAVTSIQGYQVTNAQRGLGNAAVRCVYLTNGVLLSGFTLTNGATLAAGDITNELSGGGAWCASGNSVTISNCVLAGNSTVWYGGGSFQGTLLNCTANFNQANYGAGVCASIITNSVINGNRSGGSGGGAYACTLVNCTLMTNVATNGGGSFGGLLVNCTLAGNKARVSGGGAGGGIFTNCIIIGNLAGHAGGVDGFNGPSFGATLANCTIVSNTSQSVGGVYHCLLTNCSLLYNSTQFLGTEGSLDTGGADLCLLYNCSLISNSAANNGGGATASFLYNCLVLSNSAGYMGGGVYGSFNNTLINCTVTGNSAGSFDGGIYGGNVSNCIVVGNMAPVSPNYDPGTAISWSCTSPLPSGGVGNITSDPLFANPASGDYQLQSISPCINAASQNAYSAATFSGGYTTTPPATDLGGRSRISGGTVDMGAYEFQLPATHYVNAANSSPAAPYSDWSTAATNIQDAVDASSPGDSVLVTNGVYRYGGRPLKGALLTNRVAVTIPITLRSVNGPAVTSIFGQQATNDQVGNGLGDSAVRCVYLTNGALLAGFTLTNGSTRYLGHDLNDWCGGGVFCASGQVVVSDCVLLGNMAYQDGGGAWQGSFTGCTLVGNSADSGGGVSRATVANCTLLQNSAIVGGGAVNCTLVNCLIATNSAIDAGGGVCGSDSNLVLNCTVVGNTAISYSRQLNQGGGGVAGPSISYAYHPLPVINCTIIGNASNNGGGAMDCELINCTLLANWTTNAAGQAPPDGGGGAVSSILWNCMVISNSAARGGGADASELFNSLVASNFARLVGGGVHASTLSNCTIAGNSALVAGGGIADNGSLANCILFNNTAPIGPNFAPATGTPITLNYCCTSPLPTNGIGNISVDPFFVNASAGDYHLQSSSPCINAGINLYAAGTTDLDGNPRISGGTVDMGAYEFQNPASRISYAWLQQYGLSNDGSADSADTDHNGMSNWQKWRAGLDPTNPNSVLALQSVAGSGPGISVTWQSVGGISYYLQRASSLSGAPAFSSIQSNIVGQAGTTTYQDTNAVGSGPFFYRVGVQ